MIYVCLGAQELPPTAPPPEDEEPESEYPLGKPAGEGSTINKSTTDTYDGLNLVQLLFLRDHGNLSTSQTDVSASSTPTEQLRALKFKKVNIKKDGNCFFRTISHQLNGHQKDHSRIRAKAVRYL